MCGVWDAGGGVKTAEITVFGQQPSGGHNRAVQFGEGVRVLVQPVSAEFDDSAHDATLAISALATNRLIEDTRAACLRNAVASGQEQLQVLSAKLAEARAIAEAAVTGRRRFFGPVLMRPATAEGWTGPVVLLDPVKQEHGYSLQIRSVAEVRALHPELWVVSVEDGDVLLDAMKVAA